MYYIQYLAGLCHRRHWPDPLYETEETRNGWICTATVNNRKYVSDTEYQTDKAAREAAAMSAYMICRNFSANDGMHPSHRHGHGGVIQGLPVAIGTGRRNTQSSYQDSDSGYSQYEAGSGGSSPRSDGSSFEARGSRQSGGRRSSRASNAHICYCGRGNIHSYGRCAACIREAAWR